MLMLPRRGRQELCTAGGLLLRLRCAPHKVLLMECNSLTIPQRPNWFTDYLFYNNHQART